MTFRHRMSTTCFINFGNLYSLAPKISEILVTVTKTRLFTKLHYSQTRLLYKNKVNIFKKNWNLICSSKKKKARQMSSHWIFFWKHSLLSPTVNWKIDVAFTSRPSVKSLYIFIHWLNVPVPSNLSHFDGHFVSIAHLLVFVYFYLIWNVGFTKHF